MAGATRHLIAGVGCELARELITGGRLQERVHALGYDMVGGTVEGFEKFLKDDIEFYRRLTQAAGLTPE